MNYVLMLVKVFAFPVRCLCLALVAFVLGSSLSGQFESNAVLAPAATFLDGATLYATKVLVVVAAITCIVPGWRVWQWWHLKGELCDVCVGIMSHRNGPWSPHWHCLACGHNRPDR